MGIVKRLAVEFITPKELEFFWANVIRIQSWQASRQHWYWSDRKQNAVHMGGQVQMLKVIAYQLTCKLINGNWYFHRQCDDLNCINPDHFKVNQTNKIRSLPLEQKQKIKEAFASGLSKQQIAAQFGCHIAALGFLSRTSRKTNHDPSVD